MLLEGPADYYTILLPVLDGAFRACLEGNVGNQLQLWVDSGEPAWVLRAVVTFSGFFFLFFSFFEF